MDCRYLTMPKKISRSVSKRWAHSFVYEDSQKYHDIIRILEGGGYISKHGKKSAYIHGNNGSKFRLHAPVFRFLWKYSFIKKLKPVTENGQRIYRYGLNSDSEFEELKRVSEERHEAIRRGQKGVKLKKLT